jgi:hypothetical protein
MAGWRFSSFSVIAPRVAPASAPAPVARILPHPLPIASDNDAGGVALQRIALLNMDHAGAFDPADLGAHDLARRAALDHIRADLPGAGGKAQTGGQRHGN